jgi:transcriptional regulator with XRE-family HTH domain
MTRFGRGAWARAATSSFGARLKELRLAREMSQIELARRIGRHQTAIGPYERDEYAPPRDIVERLAEALDTSPEFLVFGREPGHARVPLIGRVGPGGLLAGDDGTASAPSMYLAAPRLAGVLVEDDGMAPVLRPGQIALLTAGAETEPDRLLGRDVLALLVDGRAMLRRLLPAAEPGSFDLAAYAAPTLRGVRVAAARPVLAVLWPAALAGEAGERGSA